MLHNVVHCTVHKYVYACVRVCYPNMQKFTDFIPNKKIWFHCFSYFVLFWVWFNRKYTNFTWHAEWDTHYGSKNQPTKLISNRFIRFFFVSLPKMNEVKKAHLNKQTNKRSNKHAKIEWQKIKMRISPQKQKRGEKNESKWNEIKQIRQMNLVDERMWHS